MALAISKHDRHGLSDQCIVVPANNTKVALPHFLYVK